MLRLDLFCMMIGQLGWEKIDLIGARNHLAAMLYRLYKIEFDLFSILIVIPEAIGQKVCRSYIPTQKISWNGPEERRASSATSLHPFLIPHQNKIYRELSSCVCCAQFFYKGAVNIYDRDGD